MTLFIKILEEKKICQCHRHCIFITFSSHFHCIFIFRWDSNGNNRDGPCCGCQSPASFWARFTIGICPSPPRFNSHPIEFFMGSYACAIFLESTGYKDVSDGVLRCHWWNCEVGWVPHFGELFTLGLIHFPRYMRLTKGDKVKHVVVSLAKHMQYTLGSCSLWD